MLLIIAGKGAQKDVCPIKGLEQFENLFFEAQILLQMVGRGDGERADAVFSLSSIIAESHQVVGHLVFRDDPRLSLCKLVHPYFVTLSDKQDTACILLPSRRPSYVNIHEKPGKERKRRLPTYETASVSTNGRQKLTANALETGKWTSSWTRTITPY